MGEAKGTIIWLPLEPLEERYTEQWYRWFPEAFERRGWKCNTIVPEKRLSTEIEVGSFLDLYSSMHWFYSQLARVVEHLRNISKRSLDEPLVVFLPDVEMWGIEGIRYIKELGQWKNLYIVGFLHAASYTTEDYMASMSFIGKDLETGWLNSLDQAYVGSEYHRLKVHRERPRILTPIIATGNPFNSGELKSRDIPTSERKYDIIICDRPDSEKRIHEAILMACSLIKNFDVKIAITTSRSSYRSNKNWISDMVRAIVEKFQGNIDLYEGIRKEKYYEILGNSKCYLSATIEENFGYCCIEAMAVGTYPIVPNNFAFKDHLGNFHAQMKEPKRYGGPRMKNLLYDTQDEALIKIIEIISGKREDLDKYPDGMELQKRASIYDGSIDRIISEIEKLSGVT